MTKMYEDEDRPHRYALRGGIDGFSIPLNGEIVVAKDGVLALTEEQHKELKDLIRRYGRADIATSLSYIDLGEAERVAREHIAAHSKVQAAQGAHSTANLVKNAAAVQQAADANKDIAANSKLNLAERLKAQSLIGNQVNQPDNKPFVPQEIGISHGDDTPADKK